MNTLQLYEFAMNPKFNRSAAYCPLRSRYSKEMTNHAGITESMLRQSLIDEHLCFVNLPGFIIVPRV